MTDESRRLDNLRAQADQICKDCSEPDWDAYGAAAISEKSITNALMLAMCIPYDIPIPELSPSPMDDVWLEWYGDKYTIRICAWNMDGYTIGYAYLVNGESANGKIKWDGVSIPPGLEKIIRDIVPCQ